MLVYINIARKRSTVSSPMATVTRDLAIFELQSYVRGYHEYMDRWTPVTGQELLLKREPSNSYDPHAVAVYLDADLVGHIPYNLAPTLSAFLRRRVNKGFAEVTGRRVNRGAGYGLEIPCIYRLMGPKMYIEKLKQIIDSLQIAGQL